MPRKKRKGINQGKKPFAGDLTDPLSLASLATEYLLWLEERNYSPSSLNKTRYNMHSFLEWASNHSLRLPAEVGKKDVEKYQRYLYHYRRENGTAIAISTQLARLTVIRAFFKWLSRQDYIVYSPAADLELPKKEKKLPRGILSVSDIETILSQPDLEDRLGIRDRALMELLYSTGIRRMEVMQLKLYDLNQQKRTVFIRSGKGRKDRVVPIGSRALLWMERYLQEVRGELINGLDPGFVFLTREGDQFSESGLTRMVAKHVQAADVIDKGSCHLFRHAAATHMLENGADIRFIQQFLGHANLGTTQVYTQVSIGKLQEVHEATHPARSVTRAERGDKVGDHLKGLQKGLNEHSGKTEGGIDKTEID